MQRDLCFTSGEGGDIPGSIHPDLKFSAKVTPNLRFLQPLVPVSPHRSITMIMTSVDEAVNFTTAVSIHIPRPTRHMRLVDIISSKTRNMKGIYRGLQFTFYDLLF